jgi:hypothetical protein
MWHQLVNLTYFRGFFDTLPRKTSLNWQKFLHGNKSIHKFEMNWSRIGKIVF